MDRLFSFFKRKLEETSTDFLRYKYNEIHWNSHALGLVGPRGVGKSTMLLQYIKQNLNASETLYISADQLYFATHTLLEVADQFSKMNGKYLAFFHGIEVPIFSLSDILTHKATIPGVAHPLPHFKDYLQRGYYPFAKDVDFDIELNQVITQTMETDIPNFANISVAAGRKLKQLLMVIAKSTPFKPVYQKLADVTNLSRNDIPNHLYYMERAGIIAQLRDNTSGIRGLGKVEKVYLDNTNLIYALAPEQANIGNLRETFFMNQMRVNYNVVCSKISDFEIDGATFEIG